MGELDSLDKRRLVQGDGGTSFGLVFAVKGSEAVIEKSSGSPIRLPAEVGSSVKVEKTLQSGEISWISVRGRITSPEMVVSVLDQLNLLSVEVMGMLAIITRRNKWLRPDLVDISAPMEVLPGAIAGTIGMVTAMIDECPDLDIKVAKMTGGDKVGRADGRSVLRHVVDASDGDIAGYLNRHMVHRPYSNHWVFVKPNLLGITAMRSPSATDVTYPRSILHLGQNKARDLIAFTRSPEMFPNDFGKLDITPLNEGQVVTLLNR